MTSATPAPRTFGPPVIATICVGVSRGWIELRNTFQNGQDLFGYIFPTILFLTVMFFMRGATVPGTTFSLGAQALPGILGMNVAFGGLTTLAQHLLVEREDGTLLRAKATPNGMLGYLVGKVTVVSAMTVISLLLLLIPGMFLVDGLAVSVPSWLMLALVILVGLVATLPLGAIVGSLFENPRNFGLVMLPLMGLIAASGIFYPIGGFPTWLQWVAQVFPVYWLGLGMRSALLPDELAIVEIGQSWRHLETLGVLGAWAIIGFVLAPIVLRRMARRESGAKVEERRQRALQRIA